MSATKQTSFAGPMERSRGVLERCARQYDPDHITIAVSGGTDSVVAADVVARLGPEYGLEPDSITHIRTGTGIPQTRLAVQTIAAKHDLEYIEHGPRNQRNSLAWRVLEQGWPGKFTGHPSNLGHGREWANQKNKPMDGVYMLHEGLQVWVTGARKLESKKRSGNVPDSGIEKDKPRRVWCAVIGGWTGHEKREYIKTHYLPVSEAYLTLGFSGECVACAFDERGLLTNIDILCPELGYAIRSLATWLYQRVRRGDVDLAPKRLCWGWDPDEDSSMTKEKLEDHGPYGDPTEETNVFKNVAETAQSMVGCDEESCATRENPTWVTELPDDQLVTRNDVERYWQEGELPERFL